MNKTEYTQQRRDPRWQRRRLEIMSRDKFRCQDCGSETETLNVHHAYYVSGRACWQYPGFALVCDKCHQTRHEIEAEGVLHGWETLAELLADKGSGDAEVMGDIATEAMRASLQGADSNKIIGRIVLALASLNERVGGAE